MKKHIEKQKPAHNIIIDCWSKEWNYEFIVHHPVPIYRSINMDEVTVLQHT